MGGLALARQGEKSLFLTWAIAKRCLLVKEDQTWGRCFRGWFTVKEVLRGCSVTTSRAWLDVRRWSPRELQGAVLGLLLDSSLAPCLARVPAVLSLTLRGQQDSESHHAAMHQPRAPGAPGGSGACEKWPVVIFVAPVLQRSVVWGRDADCSQPESTGPLVCSHSGAPTIG